MPPAASASPAHVPSVPPAASPEPAPVAPAAQVDTAASLEQAGLILIETAAHAPAPIASEPPPKLGRKPRPAVVIASEPLQMVETRAE